MVRSIVVIVALTLLLTALWAIKDEKLSKSLKSAITLFVLLSIAFAYFYESDFSSQSEKFMQIQTNFKQGKVIKCGEHNVTNDKFSYEFGTSVFIAKRDFKELNGLIIPIQKCENER